MTNELCDPMKCPPVVKAVNNLPETTIKRHKKEDNPQKVPQPFTNSYINKDGTNGGPSMGGTNTMSEAKTSSSKSNQVNTIRLEST